MNSSSIGHATILDEEGSNLDKRIIDLWADIGSEDYWDNLPVYKGRSKVRVPFEEIYVPFNKRWPQPGFIGKRYFRLSKRKRIVVMAQNSRASASGNPTFRAKDDEMFDLIREHSKIRSQESLDRLFKMIREFMLLPGRVASLQRSPTVYRFGYR